MIASLSDATINSDTIHLSKCRPVLSEDDTIIEELSTKELNGQDTLKPKKTSGKHATILRNPSIRDREILCKYMQSINNLNCYFDREDVILYLRLRGY